MSTRTVAVRQSKAFARFEATIKRSLNLITLFCAMDRLARRPLPPFDKLELDDLVRAAVVLAVAAMDSYFRDVFAEKLVPFLKRRAAPPKHMVDLLSKAGLHTEQALRIIGMRRPFVGIRALLQRHFDNCTTQEFRRVDELFLAFNLKDLTAHAERRARRKNLRRRVAALVLRRHRIAHEGDVNDHGKLRTIHHEDTRRRIEDLFKLVGNAEAILHASLG